MKRFILSFLILVCSSPAFSQKSYFIYLQSESSQPFFVRMNEKVYSSSASGYLILSKLRDSTYNFTIGFPQNKWPEQKFAIQLKAKDHGYVLKNFGEKGWGLFNLQTLSIQMALPSASSSKIRTEPKEVSPFTDILAKAANDPSLRERPVVVKMEEKTIAAQPAVVKEQVKPVIETDIPKRDQPVAKQETPQLKKEDQIIVAKQEVEPSKKQDRPIDKQDQKPVNNDKSVAEIKEEPVGKTAEKLERKDDEKIKNEEIKEEKKEEEKNVAPPEYKRSVVTKKSESSTSEGFGLTFIDEFADGKKDTIRIIIPNPKRSFAETKEQTRDNRRFLDIAANAATDTAREVETPANGTINTETETVKPVEKTNCSSMASDNDLLKLRKRMAAENDNEDRVDEAKRVFKTKCFATAQLKDLSTLFTDDAGKYKFFDAAYGYVSDKDNFSSLSAELKDEYYINRFKAMLR